MEEKGSVLSQISEWNQLLQLKTSTDFDKAVS